MVIPGTAGKALAGSSAGTQWRVECLCLREDTLVEDVAALGEWEGFLRWTALPLACIQRNVSR